MRKQQIEILLSKIEDISEPDASLEQYSTPAGIAAEILYLAVAMGDIAGKRVIDLGCGTGTFAIGAALLGASAVGVDIDERMIQLANKNASKLGVKVEFRTGDVKDVSGSYDTVIQNPPFGCQRRHADIPFIEKAMEIGNVLYTIHHAETEKFIEGKLLNTNWCITHREMYVFPIKHRFEFHTKMEHTQNVVMFRAERLKKCTKA
jgi:putative methylase